MSSDLETNIIDVRTSISRELDDAKAEDILEFDIRDLTALADWMIIASGNSSRHVLALMKRVTEIASAHNIKAIGTEGEDSGEWVLLDFDDLIVHLMLPATRNFYDIEGLWHERLGSISTTLSENKPEG